MKAGKSNSDYEKCLYFSSNALARKTEALALESWKRVGLAPSHAYLLLLVLDEPGILAGQLAEKLRLTPSTVTRLMTKLEKQGLINRQTAGKTTHVFPTAKAKRLKPAMKQCQYAFFSAYTKILGNDASIQLALKLTKTADQLPD